MPTNVQASLVTMGCVCMYACPRTRTHTHVELLTVAICIYMYIYIDIYIYVYIHLYTRIYIHVYTQTCRRHMRQWAGGAAPAGLARWMIRVDGKQKQSRPPSRARARAANAAKAKRKRKKLTSPSLRTQSRCRMSLVCRGTSATPTSRWDIYIEGLSQVSARPLFFSSLPNFLKKILLQSYVHIHTYMFLSLYIYIHTCFSLFLSLWHAVGQARHPPRGRLSQLSALFFWLAISLTRKNGYGAMYISLFLSPSLSLYLASCGTSATPTSR